MQIVEAMTCHVPVITSNVSSMPEVAGEAELTVNPTSIEEISEAMTQLYLDQNLYQELVHRSSIQKK